MGEREEKVEAIRAVLRDAVLGGVRLRGVDWFAWATGGASSVVNQAAEAGVAEVLVTLRGAWVLTDAIEASRMREETLAGTGLPVEVSPWSAPERRERFVRETVSGPVASDRPRLGELALPDALVAAKRRMGADEAGRYRVLGRDAAAAVTDALARAAPDWTEHMLAGAAADELWRRGIEPAVVLVGGEGRVVRFRHPVPTAAPLGGVAMLVVCGRRHGLYANLTRFVAFRALTADEERLHAAVARIEAAALDRSAGRVSLATVYDALVAAYAAEGFPGEEQWHHQGGSTGYLAREVVATAGTPDVIGTGTALAWNPSLPGVKIEDTVLVTDAGLEVLTWDPRWPAVEVGGRARPAVWRR